MPPYKLIDSDEYNQKICNESCNTTSFIKNNLCYNCNDFIFGNPGCKPEKGCSYDQGKDDLKCNEYKENYYELKKGLCLPCSKVIEGCKKCNYSSTFKCEGCFEGFFLNNESICELNKCEEYPEITPGCLICKDKLDEFKPNSKCQSCKEGFFKTKDESCIYCKTKKNGGSGCEQCSYKDNNNEIKCSFCPDDSVFNKEGKCLKCEDEIQGCAKCKYIFNKEDNGERLICTQCIKDFYLSSNGLCNDSRIYIEDIPNCNKIEHEVILKEEDDYNNDGGGIKITLTNNKDNEYEIKAQNFIVITSCIECNNGYYYKEGKCIELNADECILSSILSNTDVAKNELCYSFCSNSDDYTMINYSVRFSEEINDLNSNYKVIKEKNEYNLHDIIQTIQQFIGYSFFYNYIKEFIKSLDMNAHMCLNNLGIEGKNNIINLKHCLEANYNQMNDIYECKKCLSGYLLDNKTKLCKPNLKEIMEEHPGLICDLENIGNKANPIYSCKTCYNKYDILVKAENGAKFCVNRYDIDIQGCNEINVDTYYAKNNYSCSKCSKDYVLYYSKYYQKYICQNIYSDIKRSDDFNFSIYSEIEEENVNVKNGICENNKLFTPDNINCFSCQSKKVGMIGCKGSCTFSNKRENHILCEENGCKDGYIEESKGICKTCEEINQGCLDCHYDNNYPKDYKGLKRKRRFICDKCENGYLNNSDGICYSCSDLGLYGCQQCKWDENKDNDLICTKCIKDYFLREDGKCISCDDNKVRIKNKCIFCNETEDGIEGCTSCQSDGNVITKCNKCSNGYILFQGNNSCIKSDNYGLEKFTNCISLANINNELQCTQCQVGSHILLEENNEIKCISMNIIHTYDININKYCEKIINVGTEEKPKYSCEKCIDNKLLDLYSENLIRFIFENNNTAFCDIYDNDDKQLANCLEALISKEDNKKIKCVKCLENSILTYDTSLDSFICKYDIESDSECEVKGCKKCQKNKNHLCDECF